MYYLNCFTAALCLFAVASACEQTPTGSGQDSLSVQNPDGLRLLVAAENAHPMLRIVLPGYATSDKSIEVLFPEHVTAVKHGSLLPNSYTGSVADCKASRPPGAA